MSGYDPLLIASKIGSGISNHLPDRDIMSRQFDDTDTCKILIVTGLPGVGANPIPNCKLGFSFTSPRQRWISLQGIYQSRATANDKGSVTRDGVCLVYITLINGNRISWQM